MTDRPLTDFVEEVCGTGHLRVEDDFGDGFVRLRSSEAQKRQAKHDIRSSEDIVIEMLRNARDAHAQTIFLATSKKDDQRLITMIDDGDGVPVNMHEKIFEPRVTSKLDTVHMDKWGVHGRGMALYSIAENSTNAYIAASDKGLGSSIVVETNTRELSEKTDQSTFPIAAISESNTLSFRGPRNILRTACEFAFAHRKECKVYLGSPAEIAATLYEFGTQTPSQSERMFCDDITVVSVAERLGRANDPVEFAEIAQGIGLQLSERTARRILDGDLHPLDTLYQKIAQSLIAHVDASAELPSDTPKTSHTTKKVKFSKDDIATFNQAISTAYKDLAEKYYLDPDLSPEIKTKNKGLYITIPLEPID